MLYSTGFIAAVVLVLYFLKKFTQIFFAKNELKKTARDELVHGLLNRHCWVRGPLETAVVAQTIWHQPITDHGPL
jgi:hypothetical protein